ncbi:RNA ligase family protein [Fictibacillus enclensis]|uniref:ATP-dependent DNA ligase n=1 Tax=Fictibacillus enclensis TaxID=1017270 RepID=UPI0025A29101|nr:RNA ligase family protein [Fictibacillus enclensis]MDM5338489.1 RNA ligase family protein [Fictibacillus enclensis]
MLLQRMEEPFNNEDYISEIKLDGIRLIYSNMDSVKLYTRHQTEVTRKFPELLDLGIPKGTVLDGELILTDHNGHPDFEAIMSRFQVETEPKIQHLSQKCPVHFCAFDILYHEGVSIMNLPLLKRKKFLDSVVSESESLSQVRWLNGKGMELFSLCQDKGLEGIVLKKASSTYQKDYRSPAWIKVINYHYEDIFILGHRKNKLGWILGKVIDGEKKIVGVTEYVPPTARRKFVQMIDGLVTNETADAVYLKPAIHCTVKYRNYTKAGLLRVPVFVLFVD